MNLQSFIGSPEKIEGASVEYGIAKELRKRPGETLYFSKVPGYDFDVVGNVVTGRDDIYRALGTSRERYISDVARFYENPIEPVMGDGAPCQEREITLNDLPVLRHFEGDAGRYITAGIVLARDPEYGRNASIHRLLLHPDNRLGIRIVPRHLRSYFERAESRGEDLEVAIVIGVHPALFYGAAYSPPLGYDEFRLAGSILGSPIELSKCLSVDLEVPSSAEIIIEGRIKAGERVPEGPFADVTGTYDRVREEPIIEVSKVTCKKDALYQALLPSSIEHRLFMGMPREPGIYNAVSEVAKVHQVSLTDGGQNWLHGALSLKKGSWDVKKVIEKAFQGHPSMKHVIIVDDDIDVFNPDSVEFALATRFQAHKDTVMLKDQRGSTLDPSTDEDGRTAKVGLDATIPSGRESDYEFARIP